MGLDESSYGAFAFGAIALSSNSFLFPVGSTLTTFACPTLSRKWWGFGDERCPFGGECLHAHIVDGRRGLRTRTLCSLDHA